MIVTAAEKPRTVGIVLALLLLLWGTGARAQGDGKIARDGFDLYYHEIGRGEPIVLLSGGPGMDVEFLRPVAEELGRDYTCILLEQRGTGRSRLKTVTPATCNLRLYIDDLEALRERLQLPKLTLLGNSWGMLLALAYGSAHPDRVRAILTMGSGPISWQFFGSFNDNLKTRLWPEENAALLRSRQIKEKEQSEQARLRAILPSYFYDHEKGIHYAQTVRFDGFNADVNPIVMGALRKEKWDPRPNLKKITAPVLLIQGRQDPAGEGTLYETQRALPQAKMVFLERCGHLPWLEQPDRFFRLCREFLAKVYGKP